MTTQQNINLDWLTCRTGDPFADVGGLVIKILKEEKKNNDIMQLIKDTTDIYVNDWKAKLNAFFLNSTITQPSYKGDRKTKETIIFFQELLNEEISYEIGYCRIIGQKTKLFNGGRDNQILSGSRKFINFHHAFQSGVLLSKEALIRMFFIPMGCVQLSDKVALLYSNNEDLIEYFIAENIAENSRGAATKVTEGIHRSEFKSPSSALFDFALRWIREAKRSNLENTELNLYHFTNFGASPKVVLHNFSVALFTFYARVQHRTMKTDWNKFTHSYFRQKKTEYKYETDTFEVTVKKEVQTLTYEEFKVWRNSIYESLIEGKSILRQMLNWVSKKGNPLNFEIVKLYQSILQNMNEKTLQIIERLADYVLEDSSNIKKNVFNLKRPEKAYEFRDALRQLEEKNLEEKKPETLFSLEEYALELFPDGTYWREIQTLLLISIYQKMHEQKIWLNDKEVSEETEEFNNS